MVSVDVAALVPGVTELALKVDVAPAGKPVTLRVTAFVKPPVAGVTLMVNVAVPPEETVFVVGDAESVKSCPLPDSTTA